VLRGEVIAMTIKQSESAEEKMGTKPIDSSWQLMQGISGEFLVAFCRWL
jgi:hypothetical protein